MTSDTSPNIPVAGLVSGLGEAAPALSAEQRIAALEGTVAALTAHAAQMQGKIGLLAVEIAIDVLTRIRGTPDPAETLRAYIESAQLNGRKVKAPPDHPYAEAIQTGIDDALSEHIAFMLRYGDFPGVQGLRA
jgi:hypothetical protein